MRKGLIILVFVMFNSTLACKARNTNLSAQKEKTGENDLSWMDRLPTGFGSLRSHKIALPGDISQRLANFMTAQPIPAKENNGNIHMKCLHNAFFRVSKNSQSKIDDSFYQYMDSRIDCQDGNCMIIPTPSADLAPSYTPESININEAIVEASRNISGGLVYQSRVGIRREPSDNSLIYLGIARHLPENADEPVPTFDKFNTLIQNATQQEKDVLYINKKILPENMWVAYIGVCNP